MECWNIACLRRQGKGACFLIPSFHFSNVPIAVIYLHISQFALVCLRWSFSNFNDIFLICFFQIPLLFSKYSRMIICRDFIENEDH